MNIEPKILSLDTSTDRITLAISNGSKILFDETIAAQQSQSKLILKFIDDSFAKLPFDISSIDVFSTTIGPGTFTGLRIGLGTVKGFCFTFDKKLIAIPTLYAMAYPCLEYRAVSPILESKKDFVYTSRFQNVRGLWAESTIPQMIPVVDLAKHMQNTHVIGAAAQKYKDFLPATSHFGNSKFDYICGKTLIDISLRKFTNNEFEDVFSLEPLYIQKTAAEGYV